RSHRELEAERITDCDGQLPDLRLRRAERDGCQMNPVSPQDCEIGIRIITDKCCMRALSVGERDHDLSSLMNHVAVGENETVGSKDETRAGALGLASLVSSALAKLAHLNVSHGGASRLRGSDSRIGIGIKQLSIVRDSRAGWGRDTRKC